MALGEWSYLGDLVSVCRETRMGGRPSSESFRVWAAVLSTCSLVDALDPARAATLRDMGHLSATFRVYSSSLIKCRREPLAYADAYLFSHTSRYICWQPQVFGCFFFLVFFTNIRNQPKSLGLVIHHHEETLLYNNTSECLSRPITDR